jgi:hypothetical protein
LEHTDDWILAVQAFLRLRGIPSVKFHCSIPKNFIHGVDREIGNRMTLDKLMESKMPFSTYLNDEGGDGRLGGAELQRCLDWVLIGLDTALDSLTGPTAKRLRLGRFSSWYKDEIYGESKYLDELERISKTDLMRPHIYTAKTIQLKWRYRLMAAFNPLSVKMQKMRFEEGFYEHSLTPFSLESEFPNCNS